MIMRRKGTFDQDKFAAEGSRMSFKIKVLTGISICLLLLCVAFSQSGNDENRFFFLQPDGSSVKITVERGRGIKTLKAQQQVDKIMELKEAAERNTVSAVPVESKQEMGGIPEGYLMVFTWLDGSSETCAWYRDRFAKMDGELQPYTFPEYSWYGASEDMYVYLEDIY